MHTVVCLAIVFSSISRLSIIDRSKIHELCMKLFIVVGRNIYFSNAV